MIIRRYLMTRVKTISTIILASLALPCVSQEFVIGLRSNPALRHSEVRASKGIAQDTLSLPFFDDFPGENVYPDASKWSDDFVFINNTYTQDQLTAGVATFDALDNSGELYETASDISFLADRLTSMPVYLNLPASDSIRLSFFFQPGGLSDVPEENDSLVLQFYAPAEGKWYPAWKTTGGSFKKFTHVIMRIDDPRFLKKGFRFRFINYASLSANLSDPSMVGNCDMWHIDYILLDRYRNDEDTVYRDVAFRRPHRSLLNTHESMPLRQFSQVAFQEMGSVIPIHYRNNDIIVRNVTRNFEIRDVYKNTIVKTLTAGASNVEPGTDVDDSADLIYTFTGSGDSALFRIKSWLITDIFDPKQNDTVVYYQRFSNYFAFDDGSAEGGYGVNGLGSRNAMVAYRFRSFTNDTLRAIMICFNDSYQNANQRVFDLMVWDDAGGLPGNVIYTMEDEMVRPAETLNGFHKYILRKGVPVEDIFYIGWRQKSETFLNAGLDINTPHGGKQFYWINGNWIQSGVSGSLMIRPVTGDPIATGISDIAWKNRTQIRFFPNPAKDYISIDNDELVDAGDIRISFTDLQGKEVLSTVLTRTINVSGLKQGLYIITATRKSIPVGYSRMIKTK
ncbi:MAG: T9SS type A sorting domain-containing protein [Bacteroidales bacterium]|nr:T9SS type A sorting domain-containing protein [Bacteroidales bacterium]